MIKNFDDFESTYFSIRQKRKKEIIMERKTLLSIYLLKKDELTQKIDQAASVRNLEGIRSTIARFFDTQLSPNGEYASQLTQTEYFIMQSSKFVNDLQKKLDEQFILVSISETAKEGIGTKTKVTSTPMAFAYSILGGLLGTWAGAPLSGTIAGLALSVLLYKQQPTFITKHKYSRLFLARPSEIEESNNVLNYPELNTTEIMKIFEEICISIDDMMQVILNQIISSAPQSQKQKPITQELGPVLKECQKHIGLLYKTGIDADNIDIFEDVWLTVGVEFIHYSEENCDYFIEKISQNTSKTSEQYPAVLINGKLYLQGLVSLPESK